jgi:hypothetical protein
MTSCARRPSNFGANAKCIASITDTLIPAGLNGKVGYIDKNGKWIIVPQFDDVSLFGRNDLAAVEIGGEWGYINRLKFPSSNKSLKKLTTR